MSILLTTPGMILNTANISSGHQATVDNRPKRAPLSDTFIMISYIALDMHMIFSHRIQHYYALMVIHHRSENGMHVEGLSCTIYYLLRVYRGTVGRLSASIHFSSVQTQSMIFWYGFKRSHQHFLRQA